jgi:biotin carboxylase
MARILLLMATRTYRSRAFMRAARKLGASVVVGSERRQALARAKPGTTITVDLRHPARAVEQVRQAAHESASGGFDAVIGVDDDTVLVATMASAALGLPHNDVEAVRATRDKHTMRRLLTAAGAPSPWFELIALDSDTRSVAERLRYPCVVKPVSLSASRGVIRADDPDSFITAVERIRAILEQPQVAEEAGKHARNLLVEGFIPGVEVALEGMLAGGRLQVLALFDKPDPLDGPFFEETIYVTPSRLSPADQERVVEATRQGAAALGLREGPIHAELRVNEQGAWLVEIAARSIGGLCSDTLEFSGGVSLEELILLHATGADVSRYERERQPSGVMMLPIPRRGVLRAVHGVEDARAVPGIVEVTISIPLGDEVIPLPEGNRYLGFVFARGDTAEAVEASLREAQRRLVFEIEATPGLGSTSEVSKRDGLTVQASGV